MHNTAGHRPTPMWRRRTLAAALGCGLAGTGLIATAAWAAGGLPTAPTLPHRTAAVGIGPAYHSTMPPLVAFGPVARCAQRRYIAIHVRSRPDAPVTLRALSVGRRRLHLERPRRAPVTVVVRDLPRRAFVVRVRLALDRRDGAVPVLVTRHYDACAPTPRGPRQGTRHARDT